MNRRNFLYSLGLATGGSYLAAAAFSARTAAWQQADDLSRFRAAGYGELIPTASKNTGETLLALPKGFEYNAIGKRGKIMSDGRKTPAKHDGMATFRVGGELRIVRNHEVTNRVPAAGIGIGLDHHYDETAGGGTTTLVIDPKSRDIIRDFVSLSGTLVNCSGGPTPWGSWISCEETTLGPTVRTDAKGIKSGGYMKPHGYCFEVFASANGTVPPTPLKAMGRFVHETIAFDRKSGIVYLTEDTSPTAGLYRFLPNRNKRLAEGGMLQMLKVKGKDNYDTRKGQKVGAALPVEWVTIVNPDPPEADVDPLAMQKEGIAKGAAIFLRLEGSFADAKGRIYFDSTSGGDNGGGQIWLYEPTGRDEGRLTMLFESPSREILDMPDNIWMRPGSGLLFICEDSDYVGEGGTRDNFVRILTPDGRMADFAKNIAPGFTSAEFAGSTFTHDGRTMFINIQNLDVTFAIWGDWDKFRA